MNSCKVLPRTFLELPNLPRSVSSQHRSDSHAQGQQQTWSIRLLPNGLADWMLPVPMVVVREGAGSYTARVGRHTHHSAQTGGV